MEIKNISDSKSNLLHLIRWISSILVVLGHTLMVDNYCLDKNKYNPTYKYIATNHHVAVIFFFVLSGFLISYISVKYKYESKLKIKNYLLDRWSRIYSVLLPSILLTIILDLIGSKLFPFIYKNPTIIPQSLYFLRLLCNIFSLQGTWGQNIQFGSNGALWSVGYEFTFYLIFTIYIIKGNKYYKTNVFWIGMLLFSLIKGPIIMAYFLIWLMGVISHKLSNVIKIKINLAFAIILIIITIIVNHIFLKLNYFNLPQFLNDIIISIPISLILLFEFKFEYFNYFKIKLYKFNIYMSHFSYTLYATHLPILFFLYSLIYSLKINNVFPPEINSLILSIFCIIFAYFFSLISEKRRTEYKAFAINILKLIDNIIYKQNRK